MCRSVMLLLLYLGGTYEVQYVLEVCAEHEKLPASAGWLAGWPQARTNWLDKTEFSFEQGILQRGGGYFKRSACHAVRCGGARCAGLARLAGWLAGWIRRVTF